MKSRLLRIWLYAATFSLVMAACAPDAEAITPDASEAPTFEAASATPLPEATPIPEVDGLPFDLSSPAFAEDETIPARFACTGENLSPKLNWGAAPEGTASLALIFDDPDAPGGTWVHWVLFNLPPDAQGLPEGMETLEQYPDGSLSGNNSWGLPGYGGPCPPEGSTHRYIFTVYALDIVLDLEAGASKSAALAAMEGHVLAESEFSGMFGR